MEGIYGFVAPDGTFYSCKKNGHMHLVDQIITAQKITGHAKTPEMLLAKHGYMTVNQCMVGIDYVGDDFRDYKHLSGPQVTWIQEHMQQFNPMQKMSANMELMY